MSDKRVPDDDHPPPARGLALWALQKPRCRKVLHGPAEKGWLQRQVEQPTRGLAGGTRGMRQVVQTVRQLGDVVEDSESPCW